MLIGNCEFRQAYFNTLLSVFDDINGNWPKTKFKVIDSHFDSYGIFMGP